MNRFARWLTAVILALTSLLFAFGVFVRGVAPGEMFMTVAVRLVAPAAGKSRDTERARQT